VLAVFNEATAIDECLASLAAQDYDGDWEVLVADGGSTDGTVDRIGEWSEQLRVRIFDNPERLQSKGLNLLAGVATAEILVRADAHTTYAPDYITRSVSALLSTGARAVGGPMRPEGSTAFGRAVARAYQSKIGIGPAPFHHSEENVEADTVYLGTMARQTFLDQGGLRTLPSGVAEDADFYYRLRQRGGRVMVVPAIRSRYRPRQTPGALWRQFYRYGLGKADMLYINGEFPSWRPLAPLALLMGLLASVVLGLATGWWLPLLVLVGLWLLVLIVGARGAPIGVAAIAIMHIGYGLGLVRGLLRFPDAVREAVS
jgi:glycosyltransferase involved in cell wall biosynthesis